MCTPVKIYWFYVSVVSYSNIVFEYRIGRYRFSIFCFFFSVYFRQSGANRIHNGERKTVCGEKKKKNRLLCRTNVIPRRAASLSGVCGDTLVLQYLVHSDLGGVKPDRMRAVPFHSARAVSFTHLRSRPRLPRHEFAFRATTKLDTSW